MYEGSEGSHEVHLQTLHSFRFLEVEDEKMVLHDIKDVGSQLVEVSKEVVHLNEEGRKERGREGEEEASGKGERRNSEKPPP